MEFAVNMWKVLQTSLGLVETPGSHCLVPQPDISVLLTEAIRQSLNWLAQNCFL